MAFAASGMSQRYGFRYARRISAGADALLAVS
jgi:hypothetical protein